MFGFGVLIKGYLVNTITILEQNPAKPHIIDRVLCEVGTRFLKFLAYNRRKASWKDV